MVAVAVVFLSPVVSAPAAQAVSVARTADGVSEGGPPSVAAGMFSDTSSTAGPAAAAIEAAARRRAGGGQAACGTNWPSHKDPPDTIEVLRTRTGKVETVDFRTYVATVMASGEFPTWLPQAALEVGATAVKQYGWYYALEGHHRSGYKTAAGVCYDVQDDTADQLYHPEWANPSQKQLDALAATWDLTLRKNDRFILTGYRYGDSVPCASDADGWHLYEQSMQDCADKGWTRQKIQETYYAPHVNFVWNDGSGPAGGPGKDRKPPLVVAPRVQLRTSVVLGGLVAAVSWGGSDAGSGLAAFRLQHSVNGAAWQDVPLSSPAATTIDVPLRLGAAHRFRVRARDVAGNTSTWAAAAKVTPQLLQAGRAILSGGWTGAHDAAASGSSIRYSTSRGARAVLTFRGRSVAIVAPTGPLLGAARVFIDGKAAGRFDLDTLADQERQLVWSHTWSTSARHRVRVQVLGVPGHPRVDLDAFVILR